jgi:uncharacterized protein
MIEMRVARLGVDSAANTYVLLLREVDGERVLPIWIGQAEAEAIVMELQAVKRDRPMTHDLLKQVILGLGGVLRRVVITRVERGTYFAELVLSNGDDHLVVDARPSDSVALALRTGATIHAAEELLVMVNDEDGEPESPDGFPTDGGGSDMSPEQLKAYLEQLRPEDLGKFRP